MDGLSAFGVQHTLSKSLVNGEFVRAVDLSAAQRGKVGGYKQLGGVNRADKKWLKRRKKHQLPQIEHEVAAQGGSGVTRDKFGTGAGTVRVGGKSSGTSYVIGGVPKQLMKPVAAHENEHAKVKRSAYRMHRQIMKDPVKLMREEARADYRSVGHFQNNRQFSGYSTAGQALDQMNRKRGNAPFKFGRGMKRAVKASGMNASALPKISNKQAYKMQRDGIRAQFPHYKLKGRQGRKAIQGYIDLQNELKAKGVPEGRHNVGKSYVPGKGWVKATELSKPAKRRIVERHQNLASYRKSGEYESNETYARNNMAGNRKKIWEGFKTPMTRRITVNSKNTKLGRDNPHMAGYARANGRGGGMVKVFPGLSREERALTLAHEKAHVTPKRNIYNLEQRIINPRRHGREEGRADFLAHGGKSPGKYANDDPEFLRGYNEVQNKMHRARQRKARR